MRRRAALLVAPLLLLSLLPASVSAAPPRDSAAAHRAAVIAYWTPARMKAAIPRDFAFDAVRGVHQEKASPNRGKPGGGGGGSTNVTGATWEGGGKMLTTSGRVWFTLSGKNYICSGSVAFDGNDADDHAIVLTAGHCVTANVNNGFATNWMFIPEFDSAPTYTCANTKHGCWVADALYASTAFATAGSFNTTALKNDWGFARVTTGGLGGGQLDTKVGSFPIDFVAEPLNTVLSSFGYPAASPWTGDQLVYSRGPVSFDSLAGNATYGMVSSQTGGSSGGPWVIAGNTTTYADARLRSVNSYKYNGGPTANRMYGPKFGSGTQAVYNAADAGGAPQTGSGVSWKDLP